MEFLMSIEGVKGYVLFQEEGPTVLSKGGNVSSNFSDLTLFWVPAAAVVRDTLDLGRIETIGLSGTKKRVVLIYHKDNLVGCEIGENVNLSQILPRLQEVLKRSS
ncbi:MAG: hypothetical protein AB1393_11045 [Candidatus Edwardsbacteria bacterium]